MSPQRPRREPWSFALDRIYACLLGAVPGMHRSVAPDTISMTHYRTAVCELAKPVEMPCLLQLCRHCLLPL